MNKRIKGRVFSREKAQRTALMNSLVRSLVIHERLETTETKARETSRFTEKLLTRAILGNLPARREAIKHMESRLAKKVIEELAPRYRTRKGGYTRITKLGRRKSDGAQLALIEFV